jgi:hypothetical protein
LSAYNSTIPAPASAAEQQMARELDGRKWGAHRATRKRLDKAEYGNWVVLEDNIQRGAELAGHTKYFARVICRVHGVERTIPESKLRDGTAQKCMRCVRARTEVLIVPKRVP